MLTVGTPDGALVAAVVWRPTYIVGSCGGQLDWYELYSKAPTSDNVTGDTTMSGGLADEERGDGDKGSDQHVGL